MAGDNRARFCESCNQTVHDFSSLTRRQAAELVENTSGRLCARINYDYRGNIVFLPEPQQNSLGRLIRLSLLGVSALGYQSAASGQERACNVEVTVWDESGAVIPGAHVAVVPERDSLVAKSGITDSEGLFAGQLSPGRYTLKVESAGFNTYQRHDVQVACNNPLPAKINVTLHVGSMGEVIEVPRQSVFQRVRSIFQTSPQ